MIIDTNTSFQSYIWSKFDLENEAEIRFDDFSSTLASLLNLDDDSLQTLFEIFDIDEDGFLRYTQTECTVYTDTAMYIICVWLLLACTCADWKTLPGYFYR